MDTTKQTPGRLTPEMVSAVLDVVQAAFRQVRPYIVERAGNSEHTDKGDGSPVTEADVQVEKTLLAALERRFPGMPVFGEESGYGTDLPDTFWLLDPIDGTKSFIANIPAYTSMAVLIQDSEAIASVIYNIAADDMYVAQKGKGAYKNGTRLNLRDAPLPRTAICKGRFIDTLDVILRPKDVTCEIGAAGGGYGFAMVAEGTFAARFNMLGGGHTHDYAPGALLVREAGGAIVPIRDDVYTYESRSFVACHPDLEAVLRPEAHRLRALEIELADKA